ncbi:MAG: aquaporin [Bacteroidota bacterium]
MRRYLIEFIGTFFLMLSICMVVLVDVGQLGPLIVGSMLIPMIYAGGHISGAHYNPAVSVGFWLRGYIPAAEILPYWLAQVLGAAVAYGCSQIIWEAPEPSALTLSLWPTFWAEFLGTFALAFVIFNVATAKNLAGNPFYGTAVGLVVVAGAYLFGAISGAAFNPAVVLGLLLLGLIQWGEVWIYLLANFLSVWIAFVFFQSTNLQD